MPVTELALSSFVELCRDKNGVCVMKCLLKALKDGEVTMYEIAYYTKRILDEVTLNTSLLIND